MDSSAESLRKLQADGSVVRLPSARAESLEFAKGLSDETFRFAMFVRTRAEGKRFENCDFSQCHFDRAYFHECVFVDCNFIGASFLNCNLRGAQFQGCQFEYATFHATLVPHEQLLENLPSWTNVQRELLRSLRLNAESVGDRRAASACIRLELAASREHLRKARERREAYYATKYGGFRKQMRVRWESLAVWLDSYLWGHGEYPGRLARRLLELMFLVSAVMTLAMYTIDADSTLRSLLTAFLATGESVVLAFLGMVTPEFPKLAAGALALVRYVALGLFIAVLFRRISSR